MKKPATMTHSSLCSGALPATRKGHLPVLLALALIAPLGLAQEEDQPDNTPKDAFEDIAQQPDVKAKNVVANPPPPLPDTQLPWDAKGAAAFTAGEKIDSQVK